MVEVERRRSPRTRAILAVGIDARTRKQRFGISRDASETGMLIATPSRFEIGEPLEVTVFLDLHETKRVNGRVIRVEKTPLQSGEVWRYHLALAFDEPMRALTQRA